MSLIRASSILLFSFVLTACPVVAADRAFVDVAETPIAKPSSATYDDSGGIWVSVSGSDASGDGSFERPYASAGRALERDSLPKKIVLRGGTYRLESELRIRYPGVTIKSMDGEWARLIGSWKFDERGDPVCAATVYLDPEADDCRLQRLAILGGYYYGVMFQSDWDTSTRTGQGASRAIIEDCSIHHTGRDCIKLTEGCDDIVIRRSEIWNSGYLYEPGTPLDDMNAEGIDNVQGNRLLVQDCYIHHTATNGLYSKGGASGCVVERCLVSDCGAGGILVGFDTSPEYFAAENTEYIENFNGVVRNCVVARCGYAGIGLFASSGARVYHNTIIDTAHLGHAPLYFGLSLQDYEPEAGRPPNRDASLLNNLVVQASGYDGEMVFIRSSDVGGGLGLLHAYLPGTYPLMDGNLYWASGASLGFKDERADGWEALGFSEWKALLGGESRSISADPLLDPGYRLRAGSPCIDAGLSIPGMVDDRDGEPRSGAPDIGADEYLP